jgi:hypothetical protein
MFQLGRLKPYPQTSATKEKSFITLTPAQPSFLRLESPVQDLLLLSGANILPNTKAWCQYHKTFSSIGIVSLVK